MEKNETYFHSVRLDWEKCRGCTNCIKRCPTEAIRVREGKANIIEQRCIDCGECIRVCPNRAKIAVRDSLDVLDKFKYKVALPAPAFFGQFGRGIPADRILAGLLAIGFDAVLEVPVAAEAVSVATREYLRKVRYEKPLISQACPAVVGLIQVLFPALIDHIIPIESPMCIAARMAKEKYSRELGLHPSEIGTFFISPCPAKVTVVRQPVGKAWSFVDGVLAINDVYAEVMKVLGEVEHGAGLCQATSVGILWGRAGGEQEAVGYGNAMAVDGIHNVISVLEAVERGELCDIDFLECQACIGGCVGGVFVAKNPFVARLKLQELVNALPDIPSRREQYEERVRVAEQLFDRGYFALPRRIEPRPGLKLDEDMTKAISKMERLEEIVKQLPGLDCGSCGSPNCRALAEDIVRGMAVETDCVFKLRQRVEVLAEEVAELARKVPPAMGVPPDSSPRVGEKIDR